MRALLALDGIDRKHHSGVISEFRRLYIKTGVFDTGLSEIIESVFRLRSDSDYNDFFIVSKDEVVEQVENARLFLERMENYLS